jgi:hypothetical protein
MWIQFLRSRGYSGSLNDMKLQFWCVDGGLVGFGMLRGEVSIDGSTATVIFSDTVLFTEGTLPNGMVIRNVSLDAVATISAAVGSGTSQVVYSITWAESAPPAYGDVLQIEYDGLGDYTDSSLVPMEAQTKALDNLNTEPVGILATRIIQVEAPNGSKIMRSQILEVTFNQVVSATTTDGVTIKVHGAAQAAVLSGSGTDTLKYTVQRAIFRHVVSWEYDGTGDIIAAASGEPLGVIPEKPVTNELPVFTVWDYNPGALDANTDTSWDTDQTRYDEL